MLGLLAGVDTCPFDLDGVLTQTANVRAAAPKKIFDEYQAPALREGGAHVVVSDLAELRGEQ